MSAPGSKYHPRANYRTWQSMGMHSVLIIAAIVVMIPIVWMLLLSIKQESELVSETLIILPKIPQWQNYWLALTEINFLKYARNSMVLATLYACLTSSTSAMAGYAFARLPGFGRDKLYALVIALILIPGGVYIVPQFVLFSSLKVVNTYWPWILLGLAGSPFHIFLFRQFFSAFPKELEEAAEVDGANPYRIFLQIILPNAIPVLATSFILNFLFVWGDFVMPILYLSGDNTTLAAVLAGAAYTNPQGYPVVTLKLAGAMIYTIPPLLIFVFFQKYILQGIVTSGLKG